MKLATSSLRSALLPALAALVIMVAATAAAANGPSNPKLPPEKANPVLIPKSAAKPVVDGKLDEEIWKSAAVLKDFYQIDPGDNSAPLNPTEVLLAYDEKTLYIG